MNRVAPFIPRLLIGGFALFLLFALFILSPWWPVPHTISDRINLAQLVVETAGFSLALMAGIFAAWEFRRSQLRPSLRLFLYDRARKTTGDTLVTTKDRNKNVLFDIYISNDGLAVARFVKIRIFFTAAPLFAEPPLELLSGPLEEYWDYKEVAGAREFVFDGKDQYVCHPKDSEELGPFKLFIGVEHQYRHSPYKVAYFISADRMKEQVGHFVFRVVESTEYTAEA